MIVVPNITYECDRKGCGVQAEGNSRQIPRGWCRAVWEPGILQPYHVPDVLLQRLEWHYCSKECRELDLPRREAHEKRVHAAYEGPCTPS